MRIKKLLLNAQAPQKALWKMLVKCEAYHTLAAHWFKTYAYRTQAETQLNAQTQTVSSLRLSQTGQALFGVSDILYLSLSISTDRLLPVNNVEVVKGGACQRWYKQLLSDNIYHYKLACCGGLYHLCKSSSQRSVSPGLTASSETNYWHFFHRKQFWLQHIAWE